MLDTVHHQGLRLALGTFGTSPVESLYVEADEPLLHLRREKFALLYALRLVANPSKVKKISNDQELIQSDPISCHQNQKGNN